MRRIIRVVTSSSSTHQIKEMEKGKAGAKYLLWFLEMFPQENSHMLFLSKGLPLVVM